MLEAAPKAPHDELKRHEDDDMEVQPVNGTLSAVFGATMQSAIMESGEDTDDGDEEYYAALEDDNANLVLDEDVDEIIEELEARKRSIPLAPSGRYDKRAALSFNTTLVDGRVSNSSSRASGRHTLGSKVSSGSNMSPASVPGPETHMHFSNTTGSTFSTAWTNDTSGNATSVGTVAANSTHVMLRGGKPVQRQAFNKKKLVLSDDMTRVFHPTQNGHAIIANHILFQMAEDNAKRLGLEDSIPPQRINTTGAGWPELPGAACSMDSSDTWSGRDPMISAPYGLMERRTELSATTPVPTY